MFANILAKIGISALLEIAGEALGTLDSPVAKTASTAIRKVEDEIKNGGISPEQLAEANRHAEKMAEIKIEEGRAALSEINQSLRAEIASNDAYVRRMRPTFGYLMALTWAAQMFAIAYVIIFDTSRSGLVLAAMSNLTAIWTIGLSVLGIYVYKRSEEKAAGAKETIFWNE